MARTDRWVRVARILLAASLFLEGSAFAQVVFNVNDTNDDIDANVLDGKCQTPPPASSCTLRAAIMQANRIPNAGATIILPAGTYRLTIPATIADGEENGDLDLIVPAGYAPGPTTIVGAGSATTLIDALGQSRVLRVDDSRTLHVSGVSFVNGYASSALGGGISNSGQLTLTNCTISNNVATYGRNALGDGGGIYNTGGLSLTRVAVTNNTAEQNGAGIYNDAAGSVTITQSLLGNNLYANDGGGLFNGGSASVDRSTIAGNTARRGGGVRNSGTLFVTNSTIAGNAAIENGGGIFESGGADNIYNSTIAYNDADSSANSIGYGGGVYILAGYSANVRNSLLVGNYVRGDPIFGSDCYGDGTLVPYGRNLTTTIGFCNVAVSSHWALLNSLAYLGPLQNNGGPTQTIALLTGSNAIDAGDPAQGFACVDQNSNLIKIDQRGFSRPVGAYCDLGAFEYGTIFKNGFE